jgi:hypothetical protein
MARELRNEKIGEMQRRQSEGLVSAERPNAAIAVNITSSYDRFKDETTVSLGKIRVFGTSYTPVKFGIAQFDVFGGFVCRGQQICKPDQVALAFSALEAYWEFRDFNNRNLILILDGERVPVGMVSQQEFNVPYVGNEERLGVILPYDVFRKIAMAQKVEAQLGRLEFSLNEKQLEGLSKLIGIEKEESREEVKASEIPDTPVTAVEDTSWEGVAYANGWKANFRNPTKISFECGGVINYEEFIVGAVGSAKLSGTWKQAGDAIYFDIPPSGSMLRLLGVFILKENKLYGTVKTVSFKTHYILNLKSSSGMKS